MTDVPYACCARCGQPLPKEILHPFKGRNPPKGLFCPECTAELVDELEEKHEKI